MNPLDDLQDAIGELDRLTPFALREALVSAYCELAFVRGGRDAGVSLLNQTRDNVDILRRRADLTHAISDTTSEFALTNSQLEAIAEIVWPAKAPLTDAPGMPDISAPTKLPAPELLQASALLWNAHWFFKTIEDMGKSAGGRFTLGEFLERNIDAWRSNVHAWRTNSEVEQHEVEEVKAMPH